METDELTKFRIEAVERLKKKFLGPNRGPLERDGCLKFVYTALKEANIETAGTIAADANHWRKVSTPEPLDVVCFKWPEGERHLGLMLDRRHALQASDITNGIARIEISRLPWKPAVHSFYRHKSFCTSDATAIPGEEI